MADEDQDDSQKTEEPTHKRLEDAIKKGHVPFSREVTSFLMLIAFSFILIFLTPFVMKSTTISMTKFISEPHLMRVDRGSAIKISYELLMDIGKFMVLPAIAIIFAIFMSSMVQNGVISSWEPIKPSLSKISPLQGLKRMFSLKSVVEFVKGIIKITVIGAVAVISIYPELSKAEQLASYSIMGILLFLSNLTVRMMIGICSIMAVIAFIDLLYQRFEYIKSLRMSRQDIKDEFKQTEGNPEVKAKLREIRAQRAQNRMSQAVPKADVVITNPTHYSVALKYEDKKQDAPVVVAKGQDFIALKIREIAREHNVPIVENAPLARALFNSVEIDEEIPFEHYHAVAEVIRYVYKLKGKRPAKTR